MNNASYTVGGVISPRPFRLRRLGHIAYDVDRLNDTLDFFARDLGLLVSDVLDLRRLPGFEQAASTVDDPRVVFLTTGNDHHSVVLLPRPIAVAHRGPQVPADIRNAHISFQLNGMDEILAAKAHLEQNGIPVPRMDRDFPGSNWHCYFQSPDGLPIEIYYGMEQIGWQRRSKPSSLYGFAVKSEIRLPVASEASELETYLASEAPIEKPVLPAANPVQKEVVGGALLDRPFRVTRIGPVSYFVDDVDRSVKFYSDMLGMTVTERTACRGGECVFLRTGTEHHSLALYPERLRSELGLGVANRNFALGMQLGSYDQLRRAGLFMADRGWRQTMDAPPELYTGIDRALFFEDPQGNRIMLYYYMEQIGWDGRPRPAEARVPREARPVSQWPERIQAPSDVYSDSPLMGPLG
jgi:catechol 2,3-dioxygenase-like lactoylglutathione lyase family enzyme